MALIYNSATVEIKGRTVSYRYRYKKIIRVCMKVISNELEVIVPEGMSNAELTGFLRENSDWIFAHLKEKPASPDPQDRTEREFKALAASIVRKYGTQAKATFGKPAELPQIKYRQMSKSQTVAKPDENIVTLNCQLRSRPKEVIEFVVAFAMAELVDPAKGAAYAECLYTLLPDVQNVRRNNMNLLKNYKIPAPGANRDPQ